MNFKVGDTVDVISNGYSCTTYEGWFNKNCPELKDLYALGKPPLNGTRGVVRHIGEHPSYSHLHCAIESDGEIYLVGAPGLKKVEEEKPFTKDDLKIGMFVTTRNGRGFRLLLGTEKRRLRRGLPKRTLHKTKMLQRRSDRQEQPRMGYCQGRKH